MALLKSLEPLKTVPIEIVSKESTSVEKYLFKGSSKEVGTTWKTLGTYTYDASRFNTIFLPTVNTLTQLSSSHNSDIMKIKVSGHDDSFNFQTVTKTLTGQTPVALGTGLFRIHAMEVIESPTQLNQGGIFLSINGTGTSSGVPNNESDTLYTIPEREMKANILNGMIPYKENGYIQPDYISYSIMYMSCSIQYVLYSI